MLDPKTCYALYEKFGSWDAVTAEMARRGIVNPRTKRPFTKQALHHAGRQDPRYKSHRTMLDKALNGSMTKLLKTR